MAGGTGPGDGECPSCGNPTGTGGGGTCQKCGTTLTGRTYRSVLEVDVAHAGETREEAREKVFAAVNRGLRDGHRGVKIIHGHGASTGRSAIAAQAVGWLRDLAKTTGGKLTPDKGNPGAHILWLN